MSIHCVFISSTTTDGALIDRELHQRFGHVQRVGAEFWLIDTGHAADQVAEAMQHILAPSDKMFVAAMTRDFVPVLPDAAKDWLVAPDRTWRRGQTGGAFSEADGSLFSIAA